MSKRYIIIETCDQCPHVQFYDGFYCSFPSYGQHDGGTFISDGVGGPPNVPKWCPLPKWMGLH